MKVRSTYGTPVERTIGWRTDEIHPYFDLDGWRFRDTPGGAFYGPVSKGGAVPSGRVKVQATLAGALAEVGWEVVK